MNKLKKNDGFALLVVLWVMVLITVVAFEFSLNSRREVWTTGNYIDHAEVSFGARSALNSMIGYIIDNFDEPEIVSFGDNEVRIFSEKLKNCSAVIKLTSENGKINANKANTGKFLAVFKKLGVSEEEGLKIIDCINDWTDADDLHRLNGAEDDYYQSLSVPYEAKDDLFTTVYELLLVKGITTRMFYGEDEMTPKVDNADGLDAVGAIYQIVPVSGGLVDAPEERGAPAGGGLIDYVRVSDKVNLTRANAKELKSLGFKENKLKKFIARRSKIRSLKKVSGYLKGKSVKAIEDKAEIINNNVFNITIRASSDDGRISERVYAKVFFDLGSKERYRVIEYKEGL